MRMKYNYTKVNVFREFTLYKVQSKVVLLHMQVQYSLYKFSLSQKMNETYNTSMQCADTYCDV